MTNKMDYVANGNNSIMNNAINTARKEVEYHARKRAGDCVICAMQKEVAGTYAVNGYKKGYNRIETPSHVRGVHVCDRHFEYLNTCRLNYSFEGVKISGKPTAKAISNSIEFETVDNDIYAVAVMVADHNFIPTEDCTVQIEYKSPIYLSLQAMTKAIGAIEYLEKEGHFSINYKCGTHLHTSIYSGLDNEGRPISKYDYRDLGDNEIYEKIFFPTCRYFDTMTTAQLIDFFGSDFRGYACNPINNEYYDYTDCHSAIFNVQHDYSLEFRLPRFCGAEKYRKIVLFMQEVVTAISYYQDNKKPAEVVGAEVLEIAKKYFAI